MATPVIVLTKADLCPDIPMKTQRRVGGQRRRGRTRLLQPQEDGYRDVLAHIPSGKTVAFIGSSGVGKSTLINRLLGREILNTREIRKDDRGGTHNDDPTAPAAALRRHRDRHPRHAGAAAGGGNLSKAFEDIAELSLRCRYKDCSHSSEPGCAVKAAVEAGELSQERFDSYEKLRKELRYEA
jgi:ribosome biogenesis GTPase